MSDIIEISWLKPYGPNSINRDENGNDKTVTVGGILRRRFASQALKHIIRQLLDIKYGHTFHTRYIVEVLVQIATELGFITPGQEEKWAQAFNEITKVKKEDGTKKKKKTSKKNDEEEEEKEKKVMTVYSEEECYKIVEFVHKHGISKIDKNYKDALAKELRNASVGIEIALFGRMSAGGVGNTIYSAAHFNHAYSIDDYAGEFDYFIASDNFNPSGAGHLDHSAIGSNTMYGYENITPAQVYENILPALEGLGLSEDELSEKKAELKKDITAAIVDTIINCLLVSPSGKQSTMASYPCPSAVYIRVVRNGAPMTMDNAFNGVIRARHFPVTVEGAKRMVDHIRDDEYAQKYTYRVLCLDSVARQPENAKHIDAENQIGNKVQIRTIGELNDTIRKELEKEVESILSNV